MIKLSVVFKVTLFVSGFSFYLDSYIDRYAFILLLYVYHTEQLADGQETEYTDKGKLKLDKCHERSASRISTRTTVGYDSFIPAISIAPLQVLYYSEALPTTARILYRSFTPKRTGNCR